MKYILLLALSQLADVASTAFALNQGAHEMNPLANFLIAYGGISLFLSFKVMLVVFAAFLVIRAKRFGLEFIRRVNRILLVLAILAFGIAALNMVTWV